MVQASVASSFVLFYQILIFMKKYEKLPQQ